ncbi:MAG: hypothetical protein HOW73_30125 [Polyangiaceae bacterium]|nr:hypothetical protein [Polyangiaceae bacterium]
MGTVEIYGAQMGAGVLVHGGAGHVDASRRPDHVEGCKHAARVGYDVIASGGSALDAVQAAARVLEDLPAFNAGTGAALNEDGAVEHDAAIMEGATLRAGGVAALRGFKNPIDVARAVLDHGRHVLLAAEGASSFALARGFSKVEEESLVTERAKETLARVLAGRAETGWAGGTIGAVARDRHGSVAAATSTGGTVSKLRGRVGDSPILGAGTLADDVSCAVSATGDGEGILKIGLARVIATLVERGEPVERAAHAAIERMVERTKANGGVIVFDRHGRFGFARSTETMSWAVCGESGADAGI